MSKQMVFRRDSGCVILAVIYTETAVPVFEYDYAYLESLFHGSNKTEHGMAWLLE